MTRGEERVIYEYTDVDGESILVDVENNQLFIMITDVHKRRRLAVVLTKEAAFELFTALSGELT